MVRSKENKPRGWIRAERVRALLRLGHEAGEVVDTTERRRHIAVGAHKLFGGALAMVVTDEDFGRRGIGRISDAAIHGFDNNTRPAFEVLNGPKGTKFNPVLNRLHLITSALGPGQSTVQRSNDLLSRKEWEGSEYFQAYLRPARLNHWLCGSVFINASVVDGLAVVRGNADASFGEEERAMVGLFTTEFFHLWRRRTRTLPWPENLPPRLNRTLELLLTGQSEKEIAGEIGITYSSLHTYVKQLYRVIGVASRAELMARAIK